MKRKGCEAREERVLVNQVAGSSAQGSARGQVLHLSPLLRLHVGVVFLGKDGARPDDFGVSAFDLFGAVELESGSFVQLSQTPINNDGAGNQAAPDGWEGSTSLDGLICEFSYEGLAAPEGKWFLAVRATPNPGVDAETFAMLADRITVLVDREQTTT